MSEPVPAPPRPASEAEIREDIRRFVVQQFLFGRPSPDLGDETSFIENRIVDSTGVLELVAYLQSGYGIEVEDEELHPDNLDSIAKLAAFIQRKRST